MDLEEEIKKKIQQDFAPEYFELIDESDAHAGHVGYNRTKKSHFKLIIVSKVLNTHERILAHRMLMNSISPYFSKDLHAFSIEIRKEYDGRC